MVRRLGFYCQFWPVLGLFILYFSVADVLWHVGQTELQDELLEMAENHRLTNPPPSVNLPVQNATLIRK